jgi:hypothetical protein
MKPLGQFRILLFYVFLLPARLIQFVVDVSRPWIREIVHIAGPAATV